MSAQLPNRAGYRYIQCGQMPQVQRMPVYSQMPQASPYPQIPQTSPYMQTAQAAQPYSYPQISPSSPYQQEQPSPFQGFQGAQVTPTSPTLTTPQYPQPAVSAQPQQVPQLRIVPMPQARPGEAPPRLLATDHDMQKHLVGQSSAGPIFEVCQCPGYYRHDSGVLASQTSSCPSPVQQQRAIQSAQLGEDNAAPGRVAGLLDSRPYNGAPEPKHRDSGRQRSKGTDSDSSSDESYNRRKRGSRRSRRH